MWSDFDDRSGILKISRTLHREKGGRLVAGDTKTYAGTRKIVLPPSTAQLLRDRKRKSFSPWVFHDPLRPEAPTNPDSAYRQLKTFLAEAELPNIRFHDGCIKIGLNQKQPHSKGGTDLVLFLFYKHRRRLK